ncbi:MAG: hypothetical protein E7001_08860 [Coriobacteriaceae bacterium]|nr:hypothetical protein [Coriobacteriaceae bacterium]
MVDGLILFYCAVFLAAFLFIAPGFIVARALGLDHIESMGVGGALTACIITIDASLLAYIEKPVFGVRFIAICGLTALLVAVPFLVFNKRLHLDAPDRIAPSCYALLIMTVLIGLIVVDRTYVISLGDPNNFFQMPDNTAHLGGIINQSSTGLYSPFISSSYSQVADQNQAPYHSLGFYPMVWHTLCSIVSQVLDTTPSLAENAVNVAVASIVAPIGFFALVRRLSNSHQIALMAVAPLASACASFPIGLFVFGPLYPNAMALACLPAIATVFIKGVDGLMKGVKSVSSIIAFVLSIIGIVFIHPNGVFTLAVLLAPYCIQRSGSFAASHFGSSERGGNPPYRVLGWLIAFFAIGAIWVGLYFAPPFQSVVNFEWPAVYNVSSGILSLLLYKLRLGGIQIGFSALVLIGLFEIAAHKPGLRWLIGSWFFAAVIYLVDVVGNGFPKHLLAGFWYTDPWRTSANLAIISIPIAVFGVCGIVDLIARANIKTRWFGAVCRSAAVAALVCIVFFQAVNPNSGFGVASRWLREWSDLYSSSVIYTDEENAFVEKALKITGDSSMIINFPFDGSIYASSFHRISEYYKSYSGSKETEESKQIRLNLNKYASNPAVAQAVDKTRAEYVLLLDRSGYSLNGAGVMWSLGGDYRIEDWKGILDINDQTPGFTAVLSEGSMRLYKIN